MIDYSECGSKIKLLLEKQGYEELRPYFDQKNEVLLIQYKGNINQTDFPHPYKIDREEFGYTVLKLNGTPVDRPSENKTCTKAVVVGYDFNKDTRKAELRLKFLP